MKIVNNRRFLPILISSLVILFGIGFCFSFSGTLNVIIICGGVLLVILGGASLIYGLKDNQNPLSRNYSFSGGMMLVVGILLIILSSILAGFIAVVIGIWMLLSGIFKIYEALQLKELNSKRWISSLILGIIFAVLAIILLFVPKGNVLGIICGVFLIIQGLLLLYSTLADKRSVSNEERSSFKCPRCQQNIDSSSKVCPYCGLSFDEDIIDNAE